MFDLFIQQIDKIKETVKNLEAVHGKEISPETLMIQIGLLEDIQKVIEQQVDTLKEQSTNIIVNAEPN
tara:strand:- start:9 stop:212 length:204 start_codon:yes stop_codon:yes gene_type:complete